MSHNVPNERCEAAHPDDWSPCTGPTDAVYVVDTGGDTVPGCIHHAAAMLASVVDARVIPGSLTGAAIEAYEAARKRRPFDFLAGGDRGPVAGGCGHCQRAGCDPTSCRCLCHLAPGGPRAAALTAAGTTTIEVSDETSVRITPAAGGVWLAVHHSAGSAVTVALAVDQAETLADALTAALPAPDVTITQPTEPVVPELEAAAATVTAERVRGSSDWVQHPAVLAEVLLRLAYLRGVWTAAGLDPEAVFPNSLFEPLLAAFLAGDR